MPCIYDKSFEVAESARKQREALDLATRLLREVTAQMSRKDLATIEGLKAWVDIHARLRTLKAKDQIRAAKRYLALLKKAK